MRLVFLAAALSVPAAAGAQDAEPASEAIAPIADNRELAEMFAADQSGRRGEDVDWQQVQADDAARRGRTREMLEAGELQTARDYWHAAFIFQHGDTPDDYLLAHVLATRAVGLGMEDAQWIAAATLDRYLQAIGQPQIYGTQYQWRKGEGTSMGDYNHVLLPDSVRVGARVPPYADQQKRLAKFAEEMAAREEAEDPHE